MVEVAGLIERHHAPQQVAGKAPDETDISPGPDTFVAHALGVRRLTPRECERLMGFPDDWTLVPNYVATLRGKRVSSDTKRYEALGNSVAVPVVEWIGRRLKAVEKS